MLDFILSIDKTKNGKYSVLFKDEKKPVLLCEHTVDLLLMMIDKIQEQIEKGKEDETAKTQAE